MYLLSGCFFSALTCYWRALLTTGAGAATIVSGTGRSDTPLFYFLRGVSPLNSNPWTVQVIIFRIQRSLFRICRRHHPTFLAQHAHMGIPFLLESEKRWFIGWTCIHLYITDTATVEAYGRPFLIFNHLKDPLVRVTDPNTQLEGDEIVSPQLQTSRQLEYT